jgi:AAA domain
MKIHAIRLREVGHFRSGVALEGLSGHFDVVAGPNEMGKSTIFRAVELLFRVAHTSDSQDVRDLVPALGGAPLIEAEFTSAGTMWRLRKRYLAQKTAELTDLKAGTLLRGADAENRLRALLAGRLGRDRMLGLLWVGQRESLALPDPKDKSVEKMAEGIGQLIESSIADASGNARKVRAEISRALDALVSKATRKPAANKPYKAAIDARDKAVAEHARAAASAMAAQERLNKVSVLHARMRELSDPEAVAARADQLARLRQSRDDAARADDAAKRANERIAASQAPRDAAVAALASLEAALALAAGLRLDIDSAANGVVLSSTDANAHKAALRDVQSRKQAVNDHLQALQRILATSDLAHRQATARDVAADLKRRVAAVEALSQRIDAIKEVQAGEPVTEAAVANLRRATTQIDRLETRLAAALPQVRIDYVSRAEGRIRLDGAAIRHSGDVLPALQLRLEIEGVGTITIAAPPGAGLEAVAELETTREELAKQLAAYNALDLSDAEARLAAGQKLTAELGALANQLTVQANGNTDDLKCQLAAAEARYNELLQSGADHAVETPLRPMTDVAAEQSVLVQQLRALEVDEDAAHAALLASSTLQSQRTADHRNAVAQLAGIEAGLPPESAVVAHLADAKALVNAREEALRQAVRELSAWTAVQLQPAARSAIETSLAAAERNLLQMNQERERIAFEIKGLEGALERDQQDGVEAAVVDTEGAVAAAQARVAAYEREVQELQLLETLLDAEAATARALELRPVVERLQGYALHVLPGAKFELGSSLRVDGIARAGESVATSRLSWGTIEQINVLVRLAYARLLADQGDPMVFVLDDALVYADERRYGAMLDVLEAAAAHHQIIMLTCHGERLASPVRRTNLKISELESWSPVA